jgi:uncharacterized protein (DUF2249 family)/hemerythrin-like domain-containing protein
VQEQEPAVTITETEAFEAMLAHHRNLTDGVARRVAALRSTVASDGPFAPPAAELVAFLAAEVLPHAAAEEQSIYRAAATREDLAATVREMTAEHGQLASLAEALASAPSGADALAPATAIGSLFAAHVAKENELLLPRLRADEEVNLAELLGEMRRLTEDGQGAAPTGPGAAAGSAISAPDPERALLSLLLQAADDLSAAGQGDRACRLVASAWGSLRAPRPDLAVRATAALHRLVRLVAAEPVSFRSGAPTEQASPGPLLDVRDLAPAQRHESIFAAYEALGAGSGFVLVNDHDPKPLRYQFEAEHAGEFTWDNLETGPQVWRVRIGRPAPRALDQVSCW